MIFGDIFKDFSANETHFTIKINTNNHLLNKGVKFKKNT